MKNTNRIKSLIGLSLIVSAFVFIGGVIYLIGTIHITHQKRIMTLETKLADLSSQQGEQESKISREGQIKLEDLLSKAKRIYAREEGNRKEGIFWVDRESSLSMITLGALNGLNPGDQLNVYEGETKIAVVTVDKLLDVISYVKPLDKPLTELDEDYYRVVQEDTVP